MSNEMEVAPRAKVEGTAKVPTPPKMVKKRKESVDEVKFVGWVEDMLSAKGLLAVAKELNRQTLVVEESEGGGAVSNA